MTEENTIKKDDVVNKTEETNHHEHMHKTHAEPIKHHVHHVKKVKKSNMWKMISGVLAILLLLSIFSGGFGDNSNAEGLSAAAAAQKAIEYINENLMQPGTTATLKNVEESNNLYNVKLDIGGREFDSYITKDGGLLFPSAVDLSIVIEKPDTPPTPQTGNVEKSDKPKVELFIMTHCPFGTQAEKGMVPVLKLLGDKIEGDVRFVHYFMHAPEETETPIQVCIREEQTEKYLDYLECFLADGNSDRCIGETKIDKAKLDGCLEKKAEEYYAADSKLSESYGVRGSPTLVINGKQASSGRDSASYLSAVCSAFNNPPEECNEKLSSQNPSSGFGFSATGGSNSAGQC